MKRVLLYGMIVLFFVSLIVIAIVPLPREEYDGYTFKIDPFNKIKLSFEERSVAIKESDNLTDSVEVKVLRRGSLSVEEIPQLDMERSHIWMDKPSEKNDYINPFYYQIRSWITLYQFEGLREQVVYKSYQEYAEIMVRVPKRAHLEVDARSLSLQEDSTLSIE